MPRRMAVMKGNSNAGVSATAELPQQHLDFEAVCDLYVVDEIENSGRRGTCLHQARSSARIENLGPRYSLRKDSCSQAWAGAPSSYVVPFVHHVM